MSPPDLLTVAVAEHQAGRHAEAASAYRKLLRKQPTHLDAQHLLALALREMGQLQEARQLLERVVRARPGFAEAHGNLGLVLCDQGEIDAACEAYRRALSLKPSLVEPWINLGNALRGAGSHGEALVAYRHALALSPRVEAKAGLAESLLALGEQEAAVEAFRSVLAERPDDVRAWLFLGTTLEQRGCYQEAVGSLERAVALAPDLAEAWNDLGNAHKGCGRLADAARSYHKAWSLNPELAEAASNLGNVLGWQGKTEAALAALDAALRLRPCFPEALVNRGILFKRQGLLPEAESDFRAALAVRPAFVQALNNLGVVLGETARAEEAIATFEALLAAQPDYPEAWNNLGNLYKTQARLTEALDAFARAVEVRPDYAVAHSNFLFTLAFVEGFDQGQIRALHEQWGMQHAAGLQESEHANAPDPGRRLRIGYVSPDFRAHACAMFLEPLLREHDRDAVEIHAYAEVARPDDVTARLRAYVDVWHSTVGLRDDDLAALIRQDGIDVLVDLAGHTADNRLLALARKPAPVQVAWLGYPATTGLASMDWRLTDSVTEPMGQSDDFYTERLMRLPHSLWCYQAPDDLDAVAPLPAFANGYVTFGSLNSYTKIGPQVIALWARVLLALPTARLSMLTVPEGGARVSLLAQFADWGISAERVTLLGRLPRPAYRAALAAVDIALDPFPCNGGTTTCDALWMGLPVVALRGNTFLSRASLSVMTAAGCPEFTAADEDEYVARCVELAADLPRLAAIRAGLRERMASSPLTDARGFARDMEAAYRKMWQGWCEQQARGG